MGLIQIYHYTHAGKYFDTPESNPRIMITRIEWPTKKNEGYRHRHRHTF